MSQFLKSITLRIFEVPLPVAVLCILCNHEVFAIEIILLITSLLLTSYGLNCCLRARLHNGKLLLYGLGVETDLNL